MAAAANTVDPPTALPLERELQRSVQRTDPTLPPFPSQRQLVAGDVDPADASDLGAEQTGVRSQRDHERVAR